MFCDKSNDPKSQNTSDAPDFWLANKIFHNSLCVYAFMHYHISLHLIYILSLHKSLVYPPFAYILYDEFSEDMIGEYSSAKYQWRN